MGRARWAVSTAVILGALLGGGAHGQEMGEVDLVEGMRNQLGAVATSNGPEQFEETITIDTSSLDAENAKILALEQELIAAGDSRLVSTPTSFQASPPSAAAAAVKNVRPETNIQPPAAPVITAPKEPTRQPGGQPIAKVSVASIDESPNLERASLRAVGATIEKERAEKKKLETRIKELEGRNRSVSQELSEAKNRLMIAETEVERLASLLEQRNRAAELALGGARSGDMPPARQIQPRDNRIQAQQPAQTTAQPRRMERSERTPEQSDVTVATVGSDKAYLRSGPGKEHSPLMSVPRGTRLVVETRNGDWYRVITPTGSRAWVASEVVTFEAQRQSASGASRTVRIRGYDPSLAE